MAMKSTMRAFATNTVLLVALFVVLSIGYVGSAANRMSQAAPRIHRAHWMEFQEYADDTPCGAANAYVRALSERRFELVYYLTTHQKKDAMSEDEFIANNLENIEWRSAGGNYGKVTTVSSQYTIVEINQIVFGEGSLSSAEIFLTLTLEDGLWKVCSWRWGAATEIKIPD